jgi:branched-chain amino acid transport system ATP-binding protein
MRKEMTDMPTTLPSNSEPTPSDKSHALLTLTNIESAYGPVKAIRGVSLEVKKGQIVTLLGSNGAGKTTLLKTISGIMDPVRGSIEFNNEDITGVESSDIVKKGISHVPEGREVFPLLTVYENLMMGAYTRNDRDGVDRDLEQAYRYFPILKERENQTAGLLSGGQQQMLAIARALLADPQMILMDEPSLGLSPKLTKEIFEIIRMINRDSGRSILLVEQNARIALQTSDFGYIMENGRIVMQDSCARLMQKDDIQEFYLGIKQEGIRAERRWKKKKTWR